METTQVPNKRGFYSKEEVKVLKDMTLSDKDVSELLNRSIQAVYCKRWALTKGKYRKKIKDSVIPKGKKGRPAKTATISKMVSTEPIMSKLDKIVFGNITIDIVNKTLIINS